MLKIYELLKRSLFDIFSKSKKIIVSLQGNLDKKIKSKPEISKEPQIKEKKVIIFNYKNYWNFLIKLLEKMKKEKFMNDNFYSDLIELNDLNKLKTFLKSF